MFLTRRTARSLPAASNAILTCQHRRPLISHIQTSGMSNKPDSPIEPKEPKEPKDFYTSNTPESSSDTKQPEGSHEPKSPKFQFSKTDWTWPPWLSDDMRKEYEEDCAKDNKRLPKAVLVSVPYLASFMVFSIPAALLYMMYKPWLRSRESTKALRKSSGDVIVDIKWS